MAKQQARACNHDIPDCTISSAKDGIAFLRLEDNWSTGQVISTPEDFKNI